MFKNKELIYDLNANNVIQNLSYVSKEKLSTEKAT